MDIGVIYFGLVGKEHHEYFWKSSCGCLHVFLDNTVVICLSLLETANEFSKVDAQFYTPTDDVCKF
jgi:hypothetical protein